MTAPNVSIDVEGLDLSAPNSSGSSAPLEPVPVGTVDCHHHIFDPRFPKPAGKSMRAIATVDDYMQLKRKLGISRSVVVAAASYGSDNSCLLDALQRFGDDARGVAIVREDASALELRALDIRQVRGARFYLEKGEHRVTESLVGFSRLAADIDWHIEIQPSRGDAVVAALPLISRLQCPVVIDHLGYTPQPDGIKHPAADALKRLLDKGHVWVKLSGLYFTSVRGYPDYDDVDELASMLVSHRPDRMLWGTDWPHSGEMDKKPDDSKLLDQTVRWVSDADIRRGILVDNPNLLYWGH